MSAQTVQTVLSDLPPSRRRFLGQLVGAGAGAAAVVAAPGVRAQTAAPGEPIRLAMIEALSGPLAAGGEAAWRNLLWAVERVNARGGVRLPGGARPLALQRLDHQGSTDEALNLLRLAADQRIGWVLQGNSSAVAGALIDAINRHNQRDPERRQVLLNYAAVEPALTNERCSFWHFRFDAHADMRLGALMSVLQDDRQLRKVFLIGQDYSFGQYVNQQARAEIGRRRPDIQIVGDELHPLGKIKDFLPWASKIRASGAQAVVTGNWGPDLTLMIKACRELGLDLRFYTFYGNALGAPAAIGEAGVGKVLAVAEWLPNVGGAAADALVGQFRQRYPQPRDDYLHARMQALIELLVQAMEKARSADPLAVARALEGLQLDTTRLGPLRDFHEGVMRASDHQFQQPLLVGVMDRVGARGVKHEVEGSGYGFRVMRRFEPRQVELPASCKMVRPG
ncbi:branched-chain amino acid ABC transporter substrate-binding protein [Pseudaquabacterium rugosum]|uniref:Branched-chain amino acid ABC transporter substrate-binding protein n=1 Tax=Pseudaquabacterium rugosum TaxID=2984194 RepID=A0ABU9BE53_9BURK